MYFSFKFYSMSYPYQVGYAWHSNILQAIARNSNEIMHSHIVYTKIAYCRLLVLVVIGYTSNIESIENIYCLELMTCLPVRRCSNFPYIWKQHARVLTVLTAKTRA